MELGPVQKDWIKMLREHPERQHKNYLGFKIGDSENYCCLGQLLVCYIKHNNLKEENYFNEEGRLIDNPTDVGNSHHYPYDSYEKLGLFDSEGVFKVSSFFKSGQRFKSLSDANDSGATWPEIADFVEENPELVFTKSV
jgi:hypothetical protein